MRQRLSDWSWRPRGLLVAAGCVLVPLALAGCAELGVDERDGAPSVNGGGLDAAAPGGLPGLVAVDTWKADATTTGAPPDAAADDGAPPDSAPVFLDIPFWDAGVDAASDATATAADALITPPGPDVSEIPDAGDAGAAADTGTATDTSPEDGAADASPDAPDTSSVDVGAMDASPADTGAPDAGPADVASPDAVDASTDVPDTSSPDASQPDVPDTSSPDASQPDVPDTSSPDASQPDAPDVPDVPDVSPPDTSPTDTSPPDASLPDMPSSDVPDTSPPDTSPPDTSPVDAAPADASPDAAEDTDVGVDIVGGNVASCADLNALVVENCHDNPSPTCIEDISLNGSLYAQGLYAPLKSCTVSCGVECGPAKDSECLEQCAIKACPLDWLVCLSNASTGEQSCGEMLDCANAYDGKWASVIAFCFAEASAEAQAELATYLSCVSEPVTESCISEAAACVGSTGNATCQETIDCTDACVDDVCYYDCIEAATPAAQSQLATLADCLTQQCGFCDGDGACEQQCLFSQCGGPAAACFLGG